MATLEKSGGFLQSLMWRNNTPKYTPTRSEDIYPHTVLHTDVHGSIIRDSEKVETTQTFTNQWMDKQMRVHAMEYYLAMKRNEVLK